MNTFIHLPVAERGPGECCLCATQKGHSMEGDYKLLISERLCCRANMVASIFPYHFNLAQRTLISGYNPGVSPWDWLLSLRAQSYQWTAKPAHHFPFLSPCLRGIAASRKGCWTGWAMQQIKRELCQPVQHPDTTVRARCSSLPCLNQMVAWRSCRLPKLTQENRRWAAPKCY